MKNEQITPADTALEPNMGAELAADSTTDCITDEIGVGGQAKRGKHTPKQGPKHTPVRTCAATGQSGAPHTMIRFVKGPAGEGGLTAPWPDLSGKLPGRGVYICPTEAAYNLALKKKAFARHLETNTPPLPWADLAALLQKDALQKISLAKKAGQLVLGVDNIVELAPKNVLKGILMAHDAGTDTRQRMENVVAKHDLPLLQHFLKEALEKCLGMPNATVVGFTRLDTAWASVHKALQALPTQPAAFATSAPPKR